MRHAALAPLLALLLFPASALAQSWEEFRSVEDRARIYFPGEASVEVVDITLEDGMTIPARKWSADFENQSYSLTIVDFADHYPVHDTLVQGSMAFAAADFRRKVQLTEDITHDTFVRFDRIPGHELHLDMPGGERLYVLIILHQDVAMDARRLYIAEALVPGSAPPPGLFLQSFEVLDDAGVAIRYQPDGVTRQEE